MTSEVFEYQISVEQSAIDEMNHVNNVVYLQWIQEIAKKHWEAKTDQNIRNNFVWVVMKHEINYLSAAIEGDTITIRTWIAQHHGAKSERHTSIIHTATQKQIVSASTTWCLLNKKTLKPHRIPKEISELFFQPLP